MGGIALREAFDGYALPNALSADEWTHAREYLMLTPQQARIVALILNGCGDKQIAATIHRSVPTVRTHLTRVFQRIQISDRHELVLKVFACARDWRERGGHSK